MKWVYSQPVTELTQALVVSYFGKNMSEDGTA
jgi:ABC-type antimicrobial peptide transport system ATPase subunit